MVDFLQEGLEHLDRALALEKVGELQTALKEHVFCIEHFITGIRRIQSKTKKTQDSDDRLALVKKRLEEEFTRAEAIKKHLDAIKAQTTPPVTHVSTGASQPAVSAAPIIHEKEVYFAYCSWYKFW